MGDEKSGYKVFVGGLSLNTDKESLKAFFEQYGEIVDSVVMRDPVTKRSRGFGFVTYSEGKSMDDCLEGAPHVVDGREVEAKRAIPREETSVAAPSSPSTSTPQTKKVFLGGLSLDTTEDEIKEVLETMGKVKEVTIIYEKDTNRPRGFGFATYESSESVDKLCQRKYMKIKDRDVEVKMAISQEDMRRTDVRSGRSGGQQGGYRDTSYSGGRDTYSSNYSRGGGGGAGGMYPSAVAGGYDYRAYGGGEYVRPESYYGYPGYDRNAAAASAYAYANYGRGGYDMSAYAGMYGAAAAGMGGAGYSQTPSSYTPARGYSTAPMGGGGGGAAADYGKDRSGANRQQAYHPYRRNQ